MYNINKINKTCIFHSFTVVITLHFCLRCYHWATIAGHMSPHRCCKVYLSYVSNKNKLWVYCTPDVTRWWLPCHPAPTTFIQTWALHCFSVVLSTITTRLRNSKIYCCMQSRSKVSLSFVHVCVLGSDKQAIFNLYWLQNTSERLLWPAVLLWISKIVYIQLSATFNSFSPQVADACVVYHFHIW